MVGETLTSNPSSASTDAQKSAHFPGSCPSQPPCTIKAFLDMDLPFDTLVEAELRQGTSKYLN